MIDEPAAVYYDSEYGPEQGSPQGLHGYPGPEAKAKHPHINVPAATNEPKPAVEPSQFVKLFAQQDLAQVVEQIIEEIADHQAAAEPP